MYTWNTWLYIYIYTDMTLNYRPMELQRSPTACLPAHVARMVLDVMNLHVLHREESWKKCQTMRVSIVMGVPESEWFVMEHPTKMHDLGVPPILGNLHMETFEIVFFVQQITDVKHETYGTLWFNSDCCLPYVAGLQTCCQPNFGKN